MIIVLNLINGLEKFNAVVTDRNTGRVILDAL